MDTLSHKTDTVKMRKSIGLLALVLMAGVFLSLATVTLESRADRDNNGNEIPFGEANIFFELNDTDGDLGIHALIDGEAWKQLEIEDPNEHRMLGVEVNGRLHRQGLTEFFFESAEPPFDELPPKGFFDRFPAGVYEVEGITLDGKELESETEVTHVMPAPPAPTVNGLPMAVQCDPDEPGFDITETRAPVTIAWPAVTMSHPDPDGGGAGVQPPVPVVIHNYEVVLEVEVELNGDTFTSVLHVVLPPGERSITVPTEFIALGEEFKYEVLAREESFNQTAVESCLKVME
jgi:hypothetical protein